MVESLMRTRLVVEGHELRDGLDTGSSLTRRRSETSRRRTRHISVVSQKFARRISRPTTGRLRAYDHTPRRQQADEWALALDGWEDVHQRDVARRYLRRRARG